MLYAEQGDQSDADQCGDGAAVVTPSLQLQLFFSQFIQNMFSVLLLIFTT